MHENTYKMKYIIITIFVSCVQLCLAQNQDSIWFQTNYNKKEYYIAMRDGVRLWTVVFSPKDKSITHPFLLMRTPYSCEPYEKDKFPSRVRYARLMKEGYIFVQQDVRGRWMSEGVFEDIRPFNPNKKDKEFDEASDTYDTAEWLLKNVANHNGNIGVLGISYPGFYATMSILSRHPAIKAVSPQAPVTDWFIGDDFHHNGALMLMDAVNFYSGFGQPRPKPTTIAPRTLQHKTEDGYQFFLNLGGISNVKTKFFGDSIKFWNDLVAHPNYDAFWKARNPTPFLTNIQPAVLTVGGWFDAEDCYGALRVYEAIKEQNPAFAKNHLVMGPWFHGGWERSDGSFLGNVNFGSKTSEYYRDNIQLRFFEHYLKGKGKMDLAEVMFFETGSNEWKDYQAFPPKEAISTSFFLTENNKISDTSPSISKSYDEYVSDPQKPVPYTEDVHLMRTREYMTDDQRFAARRPDVLVYQTDVLTEDITVNGKIGVDLFVSTTGTDADFIVKVIDVFPDNQRKWSNSTVPMTGYQMLLRGEPFRGRFRESFENPIPFKPKKVAEIKFDMPAIAHTFKRGHRLMIQVQSTWFPLVDRNPQQFIDIYNAKEEDYKKATQRIYHDKKRPSHINLMLIK